MMTPKILQLDIIFLDIFCSYYLEDQFAFKQGQMCYLDARVVCSMFLRPAIQ